MDFSYSSCVVFSGFFLSLKMHLDEYFGGLPSSRCGTTILSQKNTFLSYVTFKKPSHIGQAV